MSNRYNEDFHSAKESILKYYSDVQVYLGARLLGLSVALFAVLQGYKSFNSPESNLFGQTLAPSQFFTILKLLILFHGILLITVLMVRSMYRYASISGFCNKILVLPPFEINKSTVVHEQIANNAYSSMFDKDEKCTQRVLYSFPASFFFEGYRGAATDANAKNRRDTLCGWFWSIVIGFTLTVALFVMIG